ncbi:MPN domain-containing protein [Streptosporangium soli]|nr:hypothetical protein [Streptosporangium sp. KLBMP 9127]
MSEHYKVRIYESELEVLCDETYEHPKIETGGNLFGLFSHGGGPTVFLATRPTVRSVRQTHSVELDSEAVGALQQVMWDRFGIQLLGMWHSHHTIGLFEPSSGDRARTQSFAVKAGRPCYTEILANFVSQSERSASDQQSRRWFGDSSRDPVVLLTPFFYPEARKLVRADASLEVLAGASPIRQELRRLRRLSPHFDGDMLRDARSRRRERYQLGHSRARVSSEATGPDRAVEARSAPAALPARVEPGTGGTAPGAAPPDIYQELQVIPDPAEYVAAHVDPLLEGNTKFAVELRPVGDKQIALIVTAPRRRTEFLFVMGWDGSRPVVCEAKLLTGDQRIEWQAATREERLDIHRAFFWGIEYFQKN